jgi:hypothetical protein
MQVSTTVDKRGTVTTATTELTIPSRYGRQCFSHNKFYS